MISSGLLVDTFTPQIKTMADDGMGGQVEVWADITNGAFKGRLSSLSIDERMSQDKQTVFASHRLFCNVITLDEKARIRNSDSTRHFEIKGIITPSNLSTGHLEILVLEVKP